MEQVDIIEDGNLPAAQSVVTIVLPSIPHDDTHTAHSYGSSQQDAVSIDGNQLPSESTTIQLTQVQSAVPLEVLNEDSRVTTADASENQNLVVINSHHLEAVTVSAAIEHKLDSYHHHHNHHHQQHHHHDDDHNQPNHADDQDHHHHIDVKREATSAKSRTRFKWTKESAQVALNLVKHGCKPVLVSVAVGCSLRTAQKFVEIVKPKMEGDAFKDYEIKRRGRKSRDVNQRLEAIREVLSKDVSKTQVQIAADLKVSNTTVCRDIKRIGASWKRNESSASTASTTTAEQASPSKEDSSGKKQPVANNNNKSTRTGGSSQTRQRKITPTSVASNNDQSDSANTDTATTTLNNASTTTSNATTNVAPKHELAQQVHA